VLTDAAIATPRMFDALEVCKGPNLGTHFTLCCPYTILAHYTELDFAERCGVSRWLLRISVGTESIDELERRFQSALSHV
jgi:cystathionine gamma-synthase